MPRYRVKQDIVHAVQFDPQERPWPDGVKPWPDGSGASPRDMTWGYIFTREGLKHVQAGDWIVFDESGEKYLRRDFIFKDMFDLVEEGK